MVDGHSSSAASPASLTSGTTELPLLQLTSCGTSVSLTHRHTHTHTHIHRINPLSVISEASLSLSESYTHTHTHTHTRACCKNTAPAISCISADTLYLSFSLFSLSLLHSVYLSFTVSFSILILSYIYISLSLYICIFLSFFLSLSLSLSLFLALSHCHPLTVFSKAHSTNALSTGLYPPRSLCVCVCVCVHVRAHTILLNDRPCASCFPHVF